MPYLSGKTENKLEKYMNPKTMPCDDASSESDNFLSVFDGVGACGVWSGKFARQLAIEARRHSKNEVCLFDKDKELTKDKDNRSITILKSAQNGRVAEVEWLIGARADLEAKNEVSAAHRHRVAADPAPPRPSTPPPPAARRVTLVRFRV